MTYAERTKKFGKNFFPVSMKSQYGEYVGDVRYCIYTELSEEELVAQYGQILDQYEPYLVMTVELYDVFDEYFRRFHSEQKEWKRHGTYFEYTPDVTERYNRRLVAGNVVEDSVFAKEDEATRKAMIQRLERELSELTPIQRRRLLAKYYDKKSSRTIGKEEGVNYSKVDKSINAALKHLRKLLFDGGAMPTSESV